MWQGCVDIPRRITDRRVTSQSPQTNGFKLSHPTQLNITHKLDTSSFTTSELSIVLPPQRSAKTRVLFHRVRLSACSSLKTPLRVAFRLRLCYLSHDSRRLPTKINRIPPRSDPTCLPTFPADLEFALLVAFRFGLVDCCLLICH